MKEALGETPLPEEKRADESPIWDQCYWSKLDGNGSIRWDDARITESGIKQAQKNHDFWAHKIANENIPVPETYYTSPLTRCLETANITFSTLKLPSRYPFLPVVKEVSQPSIVNPVPWSRQQTSTPGKYKLILSPPAPSRRNRNSHLRPPRQQILHSRRLPNIQIRTDLRRARPPLETQRPRNRLRARGPPENPVGRRLQARQKHLHFIHQPLRLHRCPVTSHQASPL